MQWSDISFHPPRRTLRQFAFLWILFFGGWAAWQYSVEGRLVAALTLAALAIVVGVAGLAAPRSVRPIYAVWMLLAFPVGWVVSRVILSAIYLGLFIPIAVAFRLGGRDLLRLRRPCVDTYWLDKSQPVDKSAYFKQF